MEKLKEEKEGGQREYMHKGSTMVDDQSSQIPSHTGKIEELCFNHDWDFFLKAANRPLNKYWDSWQPRQKGFALVISRETTYSPGLRRGPRVCSQFYLQSPKNWLLLHSNTIIYLVLKAKTKINTHSFLPHHQTQEAFLHCWYLPQVQCGSLPQCKIPKNQTCITEWSCEFSMEKAFIPWRTSNRLLPLECYSEHHLWGHGVCQEASGNEPVVITCIMVDALLSFRVRSVSGEPRCPSPEWPGPFLMVSGRCDAVCPGSRSSARTPCWPLPKTRKCLCLTSCVCGNLSILKGVAVCSMSTETT